MITTIKGAPILIALILGLGITLALPAQAAKIPTDVEIDVFEDDDEDELFVYEVYLETKKKCRKGRIVIVYHDENGNGKKDKGEYVIKRLKFKKKHEGFRRFRTPVVPPEGDKIGVLVKGTDECKKGTTTLVF